MKLIKQSFQFVDQKGFTLRDIYKHIEYCARISYKSQEKITDTSYKKFVIMLRHRGHDRPLEFGTVHLEMILPDFQGFMNSLLTLGILNDIWIKSACVGDTVYITTNYRYYLDIAKHLPNVKEYFTEEDNEYYPKRYTVHMVLDRGVMDEFRTHVELSHLAESTRYCNYSKDKFNNEVTFVIPSWCNSLIEGSKQEYSPFEINGDEVEFMNALQNAQNSYLSLLKIGWTPQQARSVLPLGVKSELISCGFGGAWKNFFYRRDARDAHPMAREIAEPMHKEFIERGFIDK